MRKLVAETLALVLIIGIAALTPVNGVVRAETESGSGSLEGNVVASETREPVSLATVTIAALKRALSVKEDGSFVFSDIAPGNYELRISCVGYESRTVPFSIRNQETTSLRIELEPLPARVRDLTVIGKDSTSELIEVFRPLSYSSHSILEGLGVTVAETLDEEPGIAQRSMGPAPSRPVMRGLSGNRLMILEDGQSTGDLSATSADHAVSIEPLSSDRLEIIRGPGAFQFGSNPLGGVVNVDRNSIPLQAVEKLEGKFNLQAESVNEGGAVGGTLKFPVANVSVHMHASGRTTNDIGTPTGRLTNSSIESLEGFVGGSYFFEGGVLGVSLGRYDSDYGIPGGFLGGHPNGVDIKLNRDQLDARLELSIGKSYLHQLSVRSNYNRYFHEELESSDVCGVSFGVVTTSVSLQGLIQEPSQPFRSIVGLYGEFRDYQQGCVTFVPKTEEISLAGYYIQEYDFAAWEFQSALRFDYRNIVPQTRVNQTTKAGRIAEKSFSGFSGGFAARYKFSPELDLRATAMVTRNHPATEELFSDGPHLAAFSYEVGNVDLESEYGFGFDVTASYHANSIETQASLFVNRFSNYIYPRNTGELEFGPSETGYLVRYQYEGQDAVMHGGEFSVEAPLYRHLRFGLTASAVIGHLLGDDSHMPFIPPLNGKSWLSYERKNGLLKLTFRVSESQERLGEFEERTDGYVLFDVMYRRNIVTSSLTHKIILGVENISDVEYRKHLSRVKSVMPEPGRNFRLVYSLLF